RTVKDDTRVLPPEEFRPEDELISCRFTSFQFYSENLSEIIHGAKLCEWIRAYTILKEAALRHIFSVGATESPDEIFLRGSKHHFIELIRAGGIPDDAANAIVGHLTFKKSSKDILDAPLLPIGKDL